MSERRVVTLTRKEKGPLGTYGELNAGSYKCFTLERPYPEDIEDHFCIPPGEYNADWTNWHPKHNPCYEIVDVPGRSAILIHAANWFEELQGCIAPGLAVMDIQGKLPGTAIVVNHRGVSASKAALAGLINDLKAQPFRLIIKEEFKNELA